MYTSKRPTLSLAIKLEIVYPEQTKSIEIDLSSCDKIRPMVPVVS